MEILKIEKLKKVYKNIEVLHDISFTVKEGETLAIIGASGSRKINYITLHKSIRKNKWRKYLYKWKKYDKRIQKSEASISG